MSLDTESDDNSHDSLILLGDSLQEGDSRAPSETRPIIFRMLVTTPSGGNITSSSFWLPSSLDPSGAMPAVPTAPALNVAGQLKQHTGST